MLTDSRRLVSARLVWELSQCDLPSATTETLRPIFDYIGSQEIDDLRAVVDLIEARGLLYRAANLETGFARRSRILRLAELTVLMHESLGGTTVIREVGGRIADDLEQFTPTALREEYDSLAGANEMGIAVEFLADALGDSTADLAYAAQALLVMADFYDVMERVKVSLADYIDE